MRPQSLPIKNLLFSRNTRRITCLVGLLFFVNTAFAQRVNMTDLLTYMSMPADQFDHCMLQKGFVCYKSEGGLTGWTCLFAYANNTLLIRPTTASAVIQYVRNGRTDILMYQVHSKEQCELLQKELIRLGYTIEPASTTQDRLTYSTDNTVVTCQKVDVSNGISGNYTGYSLSLIRRRY